MRAASVLCACALLLALVERQRVEAASGDVIAASDFRLGTQGWTLAGSGWSSEGLQSEGDLIAALDAASTPASTWYYAAPPSFVNGDKTLAYNGFLSFDFGHFEYESMGEGSQGGYDIMLFGRNKKQTIGLKGVFQVDDTKLSKSYNVRLEETFSPAGSDAMWELVNVLKPIEGRLKTKAPTQHEFVTTLQQLSGIWIRGSYFKGSEATWLKNVRIIEGIMNKGSATGREETAIIDNTEVRTASTTPAAATGCCSSRTCVSNDMYEIEFDRPGCMQAPDQVCCGDGQTDVTGGNAACTRYSHQYDQSSAATIVRGTDYNEGRMFSTPGTVTPCWGAGPTSPSKSACYVKQSGANAASVQPVVWDSGTKNQNIGDKGLPIRKPFVKDYYMNAIPKICSAATLTVTVHGDIADPLDYIEVYGEDEEYLGKLFAGNLTYMFEGQRPYDPNTELWNCDGPYDPNVAGTATNVREADPHHPSGAWPKVTGYRGGVDTQPGVYGQENTHCKNWAKGGDKNPSLEFSETLPFIDSIAIPQEKMMQYSADQQIRFTFRAWRGTALENVFSGTGGGGTTSACLFSTNVNACGTGQACDGCDLDGKVLFRTIKLKFSAAACYTKKIATDKQEVFQEGLHAAQPLNVPLTFAVPSGTTGMPGGDGTLSVVVGADIFGLDKFITVYTPAGEKIGDLFRTESSGGLRSRMSDDFMVKTTSFGATDAPVPFRTQTNCDTVSPITTTDMCTPADNQWSMGMEFVNYTDTLIIPRAKIEQLSVNGKLTLYLKSDVPGSAFSPSTEYGARISPVTLSFPLLHCFMRAIKSGPNFGIYLERPRSYYFMEKGLPLPGGDVTVMFVAHWQRHVRYVTRHVGPGAATVAHAYDGLEDGLSVLRVDKDTVAEMGTVWVYKDQDGVDCCPAVYRPDFAGKKYQVPKASNCIAGACTDPDESTTDTCTYDQPCGINKLQAAVLLGGFETLTLDVLESDVDQIFVGLNIILGWPLGSTSADGTGSGFCSNVATGVGYACTLSGGGGSAYGACTYDVTAGVVSNVAVVAVGTGFESAPVAVPRYDHDCQRFDFTWALAGTGATYAGVPRTILSYDGGGIPGTNPKKAVVTAWGAALSGAATVTDISYRITGEGISQFNRNALDGGTTTGTVIVPISSDAVCQTRTVASGFIDSLQSTTVLRLDTTETTAANEAYKGYKLSVRNVGAATTYVDYDVTSYAGTITGTLDCAAALAVCSATVVTLDTGAPGAATKAVAAATAGYFTKFSSSATYTDAMALSIEIDLDGDAATGDDVYTRVIRAHTIVGGRAHLTIDTLATDTPYLPTLSTTYKIYAREATVSAALPANTGAGALSSPGPGVALLTFTGPTLVSTGDTQTVDLAESGNLYGGHKLTIYHASGTVHSYVCVTQAGVECTLDRLLEEDVAIGDSYAFYRPFKLYQALSSTCLAGSNLRITYTAGNAKMVSNDPGELDTIYSNWDSSSGNLVSVDPTSKAQTGKPSTRDVRSWVIKLTGDGYFEDLYRQQGVGAFATTTTTTVLFGTSDTTLNLASTAGISVGMYLKITNNAASPIVEIVRVRSITSRALGTIVVSRGEMGSQKYAAGIAFGATVLPYGNNVDGNGLDDMAAYGGLSRYTSTTDDAYTGLSITIFEGTGAGQTRTIRDYHGASRTAYLNTQWNTIPDDTSRYRIFYSALISDVVFPGTGGQDPTWALATFPRPVRQGYLWQIEWYDCATALVNAEGFSGTQNANSLPQCPGSLRMRIPKQGPVTDTAFADTGLNIAQANIYYTMREVDITRQEYPEMIEQHKLWPHGYSYMKFLAGEDGELLGNVFLKDYTQYNTASYYTDTITIPRDRFETYVRQNGDFQFTLQTPPGTSNIELLSVVISYPVTKEADASIYDANTMPTTRVQSHGPPPFFPASRAWSGADEFQRTAATHPRFQTHSYTSTCGNGVRDGNEYCDDGNEIDGDGCSSSCQLEAGWTCATVQTDQPSVCYQGAQGARIPDPAVGCKYYACERAPGLAGTPYSLTGTRCSGFPKSGNNVPICLDTVNGHQGTCTLCVGWSTSPADTQISGFAGRTAYRR